MDSDQSRRRFLTTTIQSSALLATTSMMNFPAFAPAMTASDSNETKSVLIPERKDVAEGDTWDLRSLYAGDPQWKQAFEKLQSRLDQFKQLEGKLTAAEGILACLELEDSIDRDLERIVVYAYLRYSENVASAEAQEMQGLSQTLLTRYHEATSFIRPELLSLSEEDWKTILNDESLALYRLKLERIGKQRPHTLTQSEERLLAMVTDVASTASKAFGLLNNADLKFGTVTDEKGNQVEVTTGSFAVLMNSPDRDVRKTAFETFYAGYQSHENTLASLLESSIKKDVFYAKARHYGSALEAVLFEEEIPRSVYDHLIKTVNESLPALHRYYELRRRKMGLDTIRMYDTYIPILSDIRTDYSWDQAVETIAKALAPLGEEYVQVMTEGLTTQRWCDRYENKGKRSGAFSYGIYSARPYILMNYKPTVISGLFTLAHEAGHSMHTWYSAKTQPFVYYNYETFVAEVASTFNEDLLSRYLIDQATDDRMKAWLINRQIDAIRQTLFRQTMFAEFEQRTHAAVEEGRTLGSAGIQAVYRELLDAYFGPKFTIDDVLATECLRVPHFYRAFYVYKYATGITASLALADRVVGGGPKERDDYIRFLRGGCSTDPISLLRGAGVDMSTPGPVEAAMRRFTELVDQLEKLI